MIFAEFEREMTSRRTAINAYERSKRGLANGGVAPLGYKRIKQKKGHLFIDEKEKRIVEDIFSTYIRLESIRKTTDYIKEKYGTDSARLKNMSSKELKSKIRDMLELVANQPENMDKQTRERSKAEIRRLFAFLYLHESQIKTALSGVHLKEPVSKVFGLSPPDGLEPPT